MTTSNSKTIESLSRDFVAIMTTTYVTIDGQKVKLGDTVRTTYMNSESDRALIKEKETDNVVTAVMAIWGSYPTVHPEEQSGDTD